MPIVAYFNDNLTKTINKLSLNLEKADKLMIECELIFHRLKYFKIDATEIVEEYKAVEENWGKAEKMGDETKIDEYIKKLQDVVYNAEKELIRYSVGYLLALEDKLTSIEIQKALVDCVKQELIPIPENMIDKATWGFVVSTRWPTKKMAQKVLEECEEFQSEKCGVNGIPAQFWSLKNEYKEKYLAWGRRVCGEEKKIRGCVEEARRSYRVGNGAFRRAEEAYEKKFSERFSDKSKKGVFTTLETLWKSRERRELADVFLFLRLNGVEWVVRKTIQDELHCNIYDEEKRNYGRALQEFINENIVETKKVGKREMFRMVDSYLNDLLVVYRSLNKIVKLKITFGDKSLTFFFLSRFTFELIREKAVKRLIPGEDPENFKLLFATNDLTGKLKQCLETFNFKDGDVIDLVFMKRNVH